MSEMLLWTLIVISVGLTIQFVTLSLRHENLLREHTRAIRELSSKGRQDEPWDFTEKIKGIYKCVQSDNPECGEANRLINDSTSLSSASWSGLNEDSVASRAKSLTESFDSSASTLASDSMRILEMETSAKHSKVRDESKAMPSGK